MISGLKMCTVLLHEIDLLICR